MRAFLTDVMDVVGLLLLVACGSSAAASLDAGGLVRGLAAAGVGLLAVSWLLDARGAGR